MANLMLARATTRTREIGIRAALGASRWQIARALLVESLVLAAAGTALALVVAWWGVSVLKAALPENLPRLADIAINLRVLAAASAAALVTGVIFGLAPAIQFSRPNLNTALRQGGRGTAGGSRQRLRSLLVTAEVALAVVLIVGAGLFISSFVRLANVEIGVDHRNVLSLGVYPRVNLASADETARAVETAKTMFPEIIDRVRAIPGVESAAFIAGGLPLSGSWSRTSVRVPGREGEFGGDDNVDLRHVTPEYRAVVGTRLLRGRYLEDADGTGAPVIVLNEEAAKRYFPDRDALGATINVNGDRTVVGIVANVRLGGPESSPRPEAYMSFFDPMSRQPFGELVVRTTGRPEALVELVKQAVWASMPDLSLPEIQTLESFYGRLIAQRRFNMLIVGLFGVLAVVIAAVGIYGVMAYLVTERTPEIGVRMALGAEPGRVLGMILGRAALYLGAGLAAGFAGAWTLGRYVETFLFQVQPDDSVVYVTTATVLLVAGLGAAFVPALRAARVDPLIALRES